ncbi:MAG: RNA polymerase sigma factor [Bacteroidota bacterium]
MLSIVYCPIQHHPKTEELVSMDEQLSIQKAKLGDRQALQYLIGHYWNYLLHYLLKYGKSNYEAEEITIRTFARAFDKIHQFDESYQFSTWLIQIAKNLSIDDARKQTIATHSIENYLKQSAKESVPSAEEEIIKAQDREHIRRQVDALPEPYKEILILRYFEELSYKEIASRLNLPVNNLKVRTLRAKKRLLEVLKKFD